MQMQVEMYPLKSILGHISSKPLLNATVFAENSTDAVKGIYVKEGQQNTINKCLLPTDLFQEPLHSPGASESLQCGQGENKY